MKTGLGLKLNKIFGVLITTLLCITIINFNSLGQTADSDDYYIFPIRPGVRNTLAGTMGELRSSHFHTGIDIRTGGVQGVPVLAAADGYLTRVVVSPAGYGNALYIMHPNGETTVYGHLKVFSDNIQQYVRNEQYKLKSFEVNSTYFFNKNFGSRFQREIQLLIQEIVVPLGDRICILTSVTRIRMY